MGWGRCGNTGMISVSFLNHRWQTAFETPGLLWLGRGGVFRGGAGRRSGGGGRGGGGGLLGAGRGGGGAGGWGGELFDGDGDQVGGDVSDHHVLAAGRHLRMPVGVSLGRHPFGFGGRGRGLVGLRLPLRPAWGPPASPGGRGALQGSLLGLLLQR